MKQAIFVGVDVSKKAVGRGDSSARPSLRSEHDRRGIAQLVKRLKKLQPVCIAIDATGGLEKELAYALAAENLPLAVVNPRQVSNFAKWTGQRAKTDAIDAAMLAHFAEVMEPEVRTITRCRVSGTLRVGDPSSTVGRDDDRRIQPTGPRIESSPQIDQFIAAVAKRPTCDGRPRNP